MCVTSRLCVTILADLHALYFYGLISMSFSRVYMCCCVLEYVFTAIIIKFCYSLNFIMLYTRDDIVEFSNCKWGSRIQRNRIHYTGLTVQA